MRCTTCDAELAANARFCTNCGTPVAAPEPARCRQRPLTDDGRCLRQYPWRADRSARTDRCRQRCRPEWFAL
ncbi:MAG: zinc ribbon domain-containing protein [Oscillochloris sp.]|nr:zinc ribbon domain-containing protein [Oscillochloris sp.]